MIIKQLPNYINGGYIITTKSYIINDDNELNIEFKLIGKNDLPSVYKKINNNEFYWRLGSPFCNYYNRNDDLPAILQNYLNTPFRYFFKYNTLYRYNGYSDNLRSHKYKFTRGICIQLLKNEIDDT